MEIDLFTLIAQAINFIILLVLLGRFLFRPLLAAMDAREKRIAADTAEAEAKRVEAGEFAGRIKALLEQQEADKERMMNAAAEEAEAARKKMLAGVDAEAIEAKQAWKKNLETEKKMYLEALRHRSGEYAMTVAEKALKSLAGEELLARIAAVFTGKIAAMDEKKAAELNSRPGAGPVVSSDLPLDEAAKHAITEAINRKLGRTGAVEFGSAAGIHGIELKMGGYRVSWSIADFLGELEEDLRKVWE